MLDRNEGSAEGALVADELSVEIFKGQDPQPLAK